ncbi:MAG: hypothetical protein WD875_13260 [Pirellulales bacterium]
MDRKIGDEVNCPGCGVLLVVPAADKVPAPPRDLSRDERPAVAGRESQPASVASGGGVFVSRRVIYAQAVLLTVAAAAAFVAGYSIGSGHEDPPPTVQQGTRTIEVTGRVAIRSSDGRTRADVGAAVLFLPAERRPRRDAKIEADALNPQRPLPEEDDTVLSAIESLGGTYARTDDAGGFRVSLPEPGRYHILVMSRALERGGSAVDRVDLAAVGEYVFDAISLIANQRYVLASRELSDGARFDHEFRE